jgi:hypothetical protein
VWLAFDHRAMRASLWQSFSARGELIGFASLPGEYMIEVRSEGKLKEGRQQWLLGPRVKCLPA